MAKVKVTVPPMHLYKVRSARGGVESIQGGEGRRVGGIADCLIVAVDIRSR